MCGAEVVIITLSSARKLFYFDIPDPDAVIHRYINSSWDKPIMEDGTNNSINSSRD